MSLIGSLGLDMIVSQRSTIACFFLGVKVISWVGTNIDFVGWITNPKDVINSETFVILIEHSMSMWF